jgi:tRNA (mo5U34)-methyltransferase
MGIQPGNQSYTAEQIRTELAALPGYWHSPIDLGHGINTKPGRTEKRFARRLKLLGIPEDLRGKRVLDVGTWDGFFALELERRGAEVHAVDIWDDNGLEHLKFVLKVRGSKIQHQRMDIHDLDPKVLGTFDLVFCAGVLYHCRHPFIAIEKLRSVTRGMLILETVTMIPAFHNDFPMIAFFPGDAESMATGRGWGISGAATTPWIKEAMLSAGFKRVMLHYKPSMTWWKRIVALVKGQPQSGRSVTHAFME